MPDVLQRIDEALLAGDLAGAERSLRRAEQERPQWTRRPLLQSLQTLRRALVQQDALLLQQVYDEGWPLPGVLRVLGQAFLQLGDEQRAADCYTRLDQLGYPLLPEFYERLPVYQRRRYVPMALRQLERLPAMDHLLLHWIKQELRQQLTLPEAGALCARALRLPVQELRWRRLSHYADPKLIDASAGVHEFIPAQPFRLSMPRRIGALPQLSDELQGRAMRLTALHDAEVTGGSSMVVTNSHVLIDSQPGEAERIAPMLSYDPLVLAERGDRLGLLVGRPHATPAELDEAFSLVGNQSAAFGHWQSEYLPKVLALLDSGRLAGVPILIDQRMPAQHRQSLSLFAGDRHPVVELPLWHSVRVRRLWLCSTTMYAPMFPRPGQRLDHVHLSAPPEALARLFDRGRQILRQRFGAITAKRRIYLARHPGQHRKLVNHTQVEAWFAAAGFEVIHAESMSFAEQLRCVAAASHIVGPEGSSLMLAAYATPGTRLAMLNHQHLENLPTLSGVLEALGVETTLVTGRTVRQHPFYPRFSDYSIDADAVLALLDHWRIDSSVVANPPTEPSS